MLFGIISFFAGTFGLIWHFGIVFVILIAAILWAIFMKVGVRLAVLVALAAGIFLIGFVVGAEDDHRHVLAQEVALAKLEDKARNEAVQQVDAVPVPYSPTRSLRHYRTDKYNRDGQRVSAVARDHLFRK